MERFPEKLKQARKDAELSQDEFGAKIGVSRRSVTAYENGVSTPKPATIRKMAQVLDVTVEYLTNDETNDTEAGRTREDRMEEAREKFGSKGAKEVDELMRRNLAFLAGGDIEQEAKDAFFEALMTAYVTCKDEARKKFTPHSKQKPEEE